ncbi:MAG: branched-chain amino acid ABC transporter substrate-binding protein, partial [Neisseriaceae bacterium]|nr:branched-chain amino acid ABC transporter substrate-binding protein [Neisseriaceae bacterium]
YGYDATRVMIAAMKKANSTDPVKYLPILAAIEYKEAVTSSNWAYDAKGDLKSGGVTVYKVTKGEWIPVETIE